MFTTAIPVHRVTPEKIEQLGEKDIFVFGSTLMGTHFGDAAQVAYEKFGAGGVAEGLKGSAYAIPVVRAGVDMVKPHIDTFLSFARSHPEYHYLVTRIGCGIAGFSDEEIAPLFAPAVEMEQVSLPASFWKILLRRGLFMPRLPQERIASDHIDHLAENEIFVFGSNLAGMHGGGAAYVAFRQFGAVMGCGVGLRGQSYAIPTMQGGVETIEPYVTEFIAFAKEHPELFFYVTRIGCGIAGFRDRDIAPLFADAIDLENVCLPETFIKALK